MALPRNLAKPSKTAVIASSVHSSTSGTLSAHAVICVFAVGGVVVRLVSEPLRSQVRITRRICEQYHKGDSATSTDIRVHTLRNLRGGKLMQTRAHVHADRSSQGPFTYRGEPLLDEAEDGTEDGVVGGTRGELSEGGWQALGAGLDGGLGDALADSLDDGRDARAKTRLSLLGEGDGGIGETGADAGEAGGGALERASRVGLFGRVGRGTSAVGEVGRELLLGRCVEDDEWTFRGEFLRLSEHCIHTDMSVLLASMDTTSNEETAGSDNSSESACAAISRNIRLRRMLRRASA